eukprot:scaffold234595_cov30-Tisochrysis_lutea.AAC.6
MTLLGCPATGPHFASAERRKPTIPRLASNGCLSPRPPTDRTRWHAESLALGLSGSTARTSLCSAGIEHRQTEVDGRWTPGVQQQVEQTAWAS